MLFIPLEIYTLGNLYPWKFIIMVLINMVFTYVIYIPVSSFILSRRSIVLSKFDFSAPTNK